MKPSSSHQRQPTHQPTLQLKIHNEQAQPLEISLLFSIIILQNPSIISTADTECGRGTDFEEDGLVMGEVDIPETGAYQFIGMQIDVKYFWS